MKLKVFFDGLTDADRAFFSPHGFQLEDAERVCASDGLDIYLAGWDEDRIVAYGMIRGWDEGYRVPRLGVAVIPEARGRGWAKRMMNELQNRAFSSGATELELTVDKENEHAIRLYQSLGYVFSEIDDFRLLGRRGA